MIVEQAMPSKDIDVDTAKKELATAEAELAKWGDKEMDGDYVNLQARACWARADRHDLALSEALCALCVVAVHCFGWSLPGYQASRSPTRRRER